MIYVVGCTKNIHIARVFKLLELMGFPWAKDLQHINFGSVPEIRTLDYIIQKADFMTHAQMKKNEDKYAVVEDPNTTALEIVITTMKIHGMAAKRFVSFTPFCFLFGHFTSNYPCNYPRINNYPSKWKHMLSFEGDAGPYLQYTHVRLASIGRNNPHLLPLPPASQIATHTLAHYPHAREIAFLLGTYPDVVKAALKTHESSGVVTYAFKLAHAISAALGPVFVKGEKDMERARAKMYLYECAREVLAAAMRLLSIRPLERM